MADWPSHVGGENSLHDEPIAELGAAEVVGFLDAEVIDAVARQLERDARIGRAAGVVA